MTISGGECLACGLIHAPAQAYGCERCGASGDQLVTRDLPATGTLVSQAAVHVHRFPTPKTPFTVLEIALDAGPVIRALAAGADHAPGSRVVGQGPDDEGLIRFAPADGREAG